MKKGTFVLLVSFIVGSVASAFTSQPREMKFLVSAGEFGIASLENVDFSQTKALADGACKVRVPLREKILRVGEVKYRLRFVKMKTCEDLTEENLIRLDFEEVETGTALSVVRQQLDEVVSYSLLLGKALRAHRNAKVLSSY